eukprot:m.24264 g.24264  ORF g.24264 m.24264 type:complete len:149 (-) comp9649_c0_seq1:747-1193(-)
MDFWLTVRAQLDALKQEQQQGTCCPHIQADGYLKTDGHMLITCFVVEQILHPRAQRLLDAAKALWKSTKPSGTTTTTTTKPSTLIADQQEEPSHEDRHQQQQPQHQPQDQQQRTNQYDTSKHIITEALQCNAPQPLADILQLLVKNCR